MDSSVNNSDIDNDTEIVIVIGVKYQAFQGSCGVSLGCGNVAHDSLKHVLDVEARLCGYCGTLVCRNADYVLYLCTNTRNIGTRQVYLVDNGNYLKVGVKRKIGVCKCLRLNSLSCINNEKRTLAGVERTRHLVVEVNVSGGIYEVERIDLTVLCLVLNSDGSRLYRYSALTLEVHVVEQLLLHVAHGNRSRLLKQSIRERAFSMVDMSYNRKVSYQFLFCHFQNLCIGKLI